MQKVVKINYCNSASLSGHPAILISVCVVGGGYVPSVSACQYDCCWLSPQVPADRLPTRPETHHQVTLI